MKFSAETSSRRAVLWKKWSSDEWSSNKWSSDRDRDKDRDRDRYNGQFNDFKRKFNEFDWTNNIWIDNLMKLDWTFEKLDWNFNDVGLKV